jgi:hypothetical protein
MAAVSDTCQTAEAIVFHKPSTSPAATVVVLAPPSFNIQVARGRDGHPSCILLTAGCFALRIPQRCAVIPWLQSGRLTAKTYPANSRGRSDLQRASKFLINCGLAKDDTQARKLLAEMELKIKEEDQIKKGKRKHLVNDARSHAFH